VSRPTIPATRTRGPTISRTIPCGKNRDILIGGRGADEISGTPGDDILIAGYTDYDRTVGALCGALDLWNSTWLPDFAARVAYMQYYYGYFNTYTVHDDGVAGALTGASGDDWCIYHAGQDVVGGLSGLETTYALLI
jgi:hypothetical protein